MPAATRSWPAPISPPPWAMRPATWTYCSTCPIPCWPWAAPTRPPGCSRTPRPGREWNRIPTSWIWPPPPSRSATPCPGAGSMRKTCSPPATPTSRPNACSARHPGRSRGVSGGGPGMRSGRFPRAQQPGPARLVRRRRGSRLDVLQPVPGHPARLGRRPGQRLRHRPGHGGYRRHRPLHRRGPGGGSRPSRRPVHAPATCRPKARSSASSGASRPWKPTPPCCGKAELALEKAKQADAILIYLDAIKLQPQNPQAYNGLGIIAFAEKRHADAFGLFEAAAALHPLDQDILHEPVAMRAGVAPGGRRPSQAQGFPGAQSRPGRRAGHREGIRLAFSGRAAMRTEFARRRHVPAPLIQGEACDRS